MPSSVPGPSGALALEAMVSRPPETTVPRSLASTARLYAPEAFLRLRESHVAVIGLGGVGSWAAEALGRSGVGTLTLIDFDHVAESNLNRQVQADTESLGKAKTDALAERLALIAPHTKVHRIDTFLTPENAASIRQCGAHFFIDACDDLPAKEAFILQFSPKERAQALLVCGAAGGKHDPGRVICADLAQSAHDPLLSKLRYGLRKKYGLPRVGRMQVPVVYSAEPMARNRATRPAGSQPGAGSPLACAGYGSTVVVTASMGMQAAAQAIAQITSATGR